MSDTPHRIALIGPGGSGKTTLATALSDRLGLPLIDETFRTARRLVAQCNTPESERPRLEQETGLTHQVDWEVRYRDSGFVADRSIYDYMIYSDLRGITWPAADPQHSQALSGMARRWWREIGGYTLVVYVPPFSDAPPEDDGFRFTDPGFVERERWAFRVLAQGTHHSVLATVTANKTPGRLIEIEGALQHWSKRRRPWQLWENHHLILRAVAAARKEIARCPSKRSS